MALKQEERNDARSDTKGESSVAELRKAFYPALWTRCPDCRPGHGKAHSCMRCRGSCQRRARKRESCAKVAAQRVLSLMQKGSEGATYGTLAKQLEDEQRHPRSVSDPGRHATASDVVCGLAPPAVGRCTAADE